MTFVLFTAVFVLSLFYPSVRRNCYTQVTFNIIAKHLRSASCNIDTLELKIGIGTEVQFCDAIIEIGQKTKVSRSCQFSETVILP